MSKNVFNQNRVDRHNENPFKRKETKELLQFVPVCESYRMVDSINDVFDVLDEKLGMMNRVMTSLACGENITNVVSSSAILKKVIEDCHGISSILQFQKVGFLEIFSC